MVAQEDPELTFPWHDQSIPTYKAIPPEKELRGNWTASAQQTKEGPHSKGQERWRYGNDGNSTPDTVTYST